MLLPRSLDPVARGRKLPLPDARPSEQIAKLFPQVVPAKDQPKTPAAAAANPPATSPAAQGVAAAAPVAKPVPLPAARPKVAAKPDTRRQRNRIR
jgi:membrane-bound lytic murein transglycosylase A